MPHVPDADLISEMVAVAVRAHDEKRPRSVQKAEGRLGPSDIGFCRQQALLTLAQVPPSDVDESWAAFCGTAIGDAVEAALKEMFPTWIIGSIDKQRVTAHLPNGAEVGGTPDIIVPEWNAVLDLKSKDGFGWVRREPWSQSYRYQTWLYAKGCVEAGLLKPDPYVGLVYIDRSGSVGKPFVTPLEPWDPTLEDPIVSWIDDVIYARLHNEDAMRDIPSPVCERICEFFTICRGGLPDRDAGLITDPLLSRAMAAYDEARETIKAAKSLQRGAMSELAKVSGTDGTFQVRWTEVGASYIEGFERQGYMKIDVRKARGR